MKSKLEYIVESICNQNPMHGKKIVANTSAFDTMYLERANQFLTKYESLLAENNQTLDDAVTFYLEMIADFSYETIQFIKTGEYSSCSFAEVTERVYNNPEIMEYYMHGLLLSQFLWAHHYEMLMYFNQVVSANKAEVKSYLEIGGGHGLYLSEAIQLIGNSSTFDVVDISASSLEMAKKMVNNETVSYTLCDIFDYSPEKKFDFITMGEVLEHVEEPVNLLKKLATLVTNKGKVFITTPTNAPAIDHICLFRNADEIRAIIDEAGFKIEEEKCVFAENLPPKLLEKYKISMLYAGLLSKK